MNGFIVMDSLGYSSESIVLTCWETREDMDNYYQTNSVNFGKPD